LEILAGNNLEMEWEVPVGTAASKTKGQGNKPETTEDDDEELFGRKEADSLLRWSIENRVHRSSSNLDLVSFY
jgi:hypothetical protein